MSGGFPPRPAFLPALADLGPLAGAEVAITGQSGVLGSLVAARLAAGGAHVRGYSGDVGDAQALASWVADQAATHVFHFAARVPVESVEADPLGAYAINAIGTWNLVRALALRGRPAWLFHCSSSHVYAPSSGAPLAEDASTRPATWYGHTKLAAERLLAETGARAGLQWCIGRVFSYTHARQRPPYLVPSLRERVRALPTGAPLELRNPASVRDLMDGEHVAEAILLLARAGATGIVNIGGGVPLSVAAIAEAVASEQGRTIRVRAAGDAGSDALVADTKRLRALLGAPA